MKTQGQWRGLIGGFILMVALMFMLVLGLVYADLFLMNDLSIDAPIAGLIILPGTAVAAAIGLRVTRLRWGNTILAALTNGIAVILFSRLEISPFHSFFWLSMDPRMLLDLRAAGIFLVISTAGVFLLPFFDPRARKEGPAPTPWKVAVVAFALLLLSLLVDYLSARGYLLGLVTLILGSVTALVLIVLGSVLGLSRFETIGAWAGGLGLLVEGFAALAWLLLGKPWFP